MMKILETLLKVKIGIVFFSIFFAGPTPLLLGNNDTVLIKSCINQMFEGMAAFDSSMVHRSFADGFLLRSVIKSKDGTIIVREESGDSFLKIIGTKKPGVIYGDRLALLAQLELHYTDRRRYGYSMDALPFLSHRHFQPLWCQCFYHGKTTRRVEDIVYHRYQAEGRLCRVIISDGGLECCYA